MLVYLICLKKVLNFFKCEINLKKLLYFKINWLKEMNFFFFFFVFINLSSLIFLFEEKINHF